MPSEILDREELDEDGLEKEAIAFFEMMQQRAEAGEKEAVLTYGAVEMTLGLPPLGEGDRSLVYPLKRTGLEIPGGLCVKVAKQQAICRQRLLEESLTTEYFLSAGVITPRIRYLDPAGRFSIKDFIEGESVTSLYMRFETLTVRTQNLVIQGLECFLGRLLELFRQKPEYKVSVSPNNIYVLSDGGRFKDPVEYVLIDPGPTPKKNYDGFDFARYWNEVLPERIRKYRKTGYLQWLVPTQVTKSERDEAKEFDVFRGLEPAEVFLLLKSARTVAFDAEETILREGAIGGNFYLILEGDVELRKGHFTREGEWNPVVSRGSVLGEMGFLLQVPRSMTAVAKTPCKLIEIDSDHFHELLTAGLTAPYKLLHNIAIILAERLYTLDMAHQKLLESLRAAPVDGACHG